MQESGQLGPEQKKQLASAHDSFLTKLTDLSRQRQSFAQSLAQNLPHETICQQPLLDFVAQVVAYGSPPHTGT